MPTKNGKPASWAWCMGQADKISIGVSTVMPVSDIHADVNIVCTITKVIFNDPATIVVWKDGSKTVVKCQEGDVFDKEKGLALAISKKVLGNKSNFNNVFKKWID